MYRELVVYKLAYNQALKIHEITKLFPKEEKYSLTNQIRRSARSVCSNIGEVYRKRRYRAHFISKLSDSDMENTETQVWIDFAHSCKYINEREKYELSTKSHEIGRLLNFMISNPHKFLPKSQK